MVGAGIVGLNAALELRRMHPTARILVLERGALPRGASTKNAGFSCFGSISELSSDLSLYGHEAVVDLVQRRYRGVALLRSLLGPKAMDYQRHGGHEVFLQRDQSMFEQCLTDLPVINELLTPVFGSAPFRLQKNSFGFQGVLPQYISSPFEGQIDTGAMMYSLLALVRKRGIEVLYGMEVLGYEEAPFGVEVALADFSFTTGYLLIATNGFGQQLTPEEVLPARAQVLITQPIPGLHIQGVFHLDQGYYYFRNVGQRLLLGGGRNLDIAAETTTEFGLTDLIQDRLVHLLREVILPDQTFEIEQRWSGIMGMGPSKTPIVKHLSKRVFCGLRLGGMGVAIGSKVGQELAQLLNTND